MGRAQGSNKTVTRVREVWRGGLEKRGKMNATKIFGIFITFLSSYRKLLTAFRLKFKVQIIKKSIKLCSLLY